jgi:hypothetical protein
MPSLEEFLASTAQLEAPPCELRLSSTRAARCGKSNYAYVLNPARLLLISTRIVWLRLPWSYSGLVCRPVKRPKKSFRAAVTAGSKSTRINLESTNIPPRAPTFQPRLPAVKRRERPSSRICETVLHGDPCPRSMLRIVLLSPIISMVSSKSSRRFSIESILFSSFANACAQRVLWLKTVWWH